MKLIIVQAIVFVVILGLFYLTFRKDKTKIGIQDMSIVTILCVLTAVLSKTLSIKFPPGQPIFVISFALIFAILIGILFSPKLALIAGLITDLIGILLAPASGDGSMPFLGFTLSAMLACYLPALIVKYTKNFKARTMNLYVVIMLLSFVLLASVYLFSVSEISIDQSTTQLSDSLRLIIIGVLLLIMIVIVGSNYVISQRFKAVSDDSYLTISHLTFIILVVEIVCHIILTSYWINVMYEIPFLIAAATRIIKAVLILPIYLVVIYFIIRYIPNSLKSNIIK